VLNCKLHRSDNRLLTANKSQENTKARFQVLAARRMKMTVIWDVAHCSLAEVYKRFSGACCLHH
jgi:hypothetical protein